MRKIILILLAVSIFSCNSSSTKEPPLTRDDTARKDSKINEQPVVTFTGAEKILVTDIPASIIVMGKVTEVWKWKDNSGENLLILSQVDPFTDNGKRGDDEEGQTASLHVLHYIKKNDKYDYVWGSSDEVKNCPVDITCSFIPGSATITDLNKNGIAELKIQYSKACRGDVSPATMKLIMRENGREYSLTGNRWMAYSPDLKFDVNENNVNLESTPKLKDESAELERTIGRYESENQFAGAPPEFLTFARNEWLKFVKEKIGE
jgi:hypothetical protein